MKADGQTASLDERLKRLIALHGPISIATYMAQCLSDPDQGYYTTASPIGAEGDFTTAPEISQMFGELIGIWFLSVWQQAGRPTPFRLVELGPGRGTLITDMVRAIRSNPEAAEALDLHLVEISEALTQQQKTSLAKIDSTATWHQSIQTLPDAPLFIVANEFFDALPIHQWVYHDNKWHERVVGIGRDDAGQNHLTFGLGAVKDLPSPITSPRPDEGAIREQCPMAEAIISQLSNHLSSHGGAALFIDYGCDRDGYGDTFQALRKHQYASPLQSPGKQDLTAHVNFMALVEAARKALSESSINSITVSPIIRQGQFLLSMGLLERAGQLGAGKGQAQQDDIRTAVERLAAPEQMGDLFKLLALYGSEIQAPVFSELT